MALEEMKADIEEHDVKSTQLEVSDLCYVDDKPEDNENETFSTATKLKDNIKQLAERNIQNLNLTFIQALDESKEPQVGVIRENLEEKTTIMMYQRLRIDALKNSDVKRENIQTISKQPNSNHLGPSRCTSRVVVLDIIKTANEIYKCGLCNFRRSNIEQLKRHLIYRHLQFQSKYRKPFFTYLEQHEIKANFQTRIKKNEGQLCENLKNPLNFHKMTRCKQNLKTYDVIDKGTEKVQNFSCDICSFQTKYAGNLKSHSLIHKSIKGKDIFFCNLCNFKSNKADSLKRHVLAHKYIKEMKQFCCKICYFKTTEIEMSKNHFSVHKEINQVKHFACAVCNYQTKRRFNMEKHVRTHQYIEEGKRFSCDICDYKTKSTGCLKMHVLTHKYFKEIQQFSCNICNFETTESQTLIHDDINEVKYFACDICSYKTQYNVDMKNHILTHEDIKIEHASDLCNYKIECDNDQEVHEQMEKFELFSCDMCDFKTNFSRDLKSHVQIHMSIK